MGTAARVVLGLVFLLSGAVKARDPRWPVTARRFGTPRWAAPLLPYVEIVLGAVLVAQLAVPWPALAAVFLLAGFTAAAVVHMARRDEVPCGCFGATSTRPVGVETLARNAVLCLLAVLSTR